MVTFMKKYSKDPKKGLRRVWLICQDKLLNRSGPFTKILELAFHAKESNYPIDPDVLVGWERAICQLGITNCAILTEC